MKKVVFAGCSFTAGSGWDKNNHSAKVSDCPALWVNLCHQNINQIKNLELHNIGIVGASNPEIFEELVKTISEFGNTIDTIFCQWTSYPRYNFNAGFELWNTSEEFHSRNPQRIHDITMRSGEKYSRQYIHDLINRLLVLHHPHWGILQIVKFTNILKSLSEKIGIKNLYFINGLCHWDLDYFKQLENVQPEDYTLYTKNQIINIDQRNDKDIHKLYNIAHTQYKEVGGIDPKDWINLYDSFRDHQVDYNFDNSHPGVKSNENYFNLVTAFFKNK